jgi:hypothetical protein
MKNFRLLVYCFIAFVDIAKSFSNDPFVGVFSNNKWRSFQPIVPEIGFLLLDTTQSEAGN